MNILVSNDDGYLAEGIITLAESLQQFGNIYVVAPNENKSASSSSLSVQKDIKVEQVSKRVFVVHGTPSDCVHLALTGLLDVKFDLVVTGINFGANLGDDVIYSGTVAGAIEGRFLGLPSIAISLASWRCDNFVTAAKVVVNLIKNITQSELNHKIILNVNVPDVPFEKLEGFTITRLGSRHPSANAVQDKNNKNIYRIGDNGQQDDNSEGTDFYAIKHNQVSITPLQIDLTKYNEIDNLKKWLLSL